MVEFYFGQLVEYVRNQAEAHPPLEEQDDDDVQRDDSRETGDRRAASPDGPLSFCPEGCYWPCEHR